MNLKSVFKIFGFFYIYNALRRCLERSAPTPENTILNSDHQPVSDTSPEKELDRQDPTPEPTQEESKSTESVSGSQDPTPEPTQNTKNPQKKPSNRPGIRGRRPKKESGLAQKLPPETKPKLICRETCSHSQWQILLVLPQSENTDVSQEDSELSRNNSGEYPLSYFTKEITWSQNGGNETIKLFDGAYPLIFKLHKKWKDDGRKVKEIFDGYYVVFVPQEWQREGHVPIEPSRCSDNTFSAHYFCSDGTDEPGGFNECASFFSQKRFSLEDRTIADDSDHGDLYVGTPPELVDINDWQDVSWVRVGEEGGGKWGENFKPTESNFTTAKVLANREGRFYVRIYDEDVHLMHGIDFRYLADLEAILVNGVPYSPENIIAPTDSNGHTETTIQFVGNVQAKSDTPDIAVDENNMASIARNPVLDETNWTLTGNNRRIKVRIHLPRIWWRLDNADSDSGEWHDKAFEMSRDEFRENRGEKIVVRLPVATTEISVGFGTFDQYEGARKYHAELNNDGKTKQVKLQLRDFCDHIEVSEYSPRGSNLQIRCHDAIFSVVRILPDAPPQKPKPDAPPQKPKTGVATLRPATKNKRFSRAELAEAGLTPAKAKHLKIAVDKWRKTAYCINIEQLKNI